MKIDLLVSTQIIAGIKLEKGINIISKEDGEKLLKDKWALELIHKDLMIVIEEEIKQETKEEVPVKNKKVKKSKKKNSIIFE